MWSAQEAKELKELYGTVFAKDGMEAAVLAVATRAVELAAARVGAPVELPDGFDDVLTDMETCGTKREAQAAVTVRGLLATYTAQGATVATLQAEVARLKSIIAYVQECEGGPRLLTEAWALAADRQDEVREDAAELREEVVALEERKRVDTAHIETIEQEKTALRSEVATLQAKVEEAEGEITGLRAAFDQEQGIARRALNERDSLRAEVERLKEKESYLANLAMDWQRKLTAAESRLAAIRTCLLEHDTEDGPDFVQTVNDIRKVLEGDAPQEVKASAPTCNICGPHGCIDERHRRYPCSPTCTHDDAANPGHPERVKERSEAFNAAGICAAEQCERHAAYDMGAEAMRAACWTAVEPVLRANLGAAPGDPVYDEAKAAIIGATQ